LRLYFSKKWGKTGPNRDLCSFGRSEERKEKNRIELVKRKKTGTFLLSEATPTLLGGTAFGAPHARQEGQI